MLAALHRRTHRPLFSWCARRGASPLVDAAYPVAEFCRSQQEKRAERAVFNGDRIADGQQRIRIILIFPHLAVVERDLGAKVWRAAEGGDLCGDGLDFTGESGSLRPFAACSGRNLPRWGWLSARVPPLQARRARARRVQARRRRPRAAPSAQNHGRRACHSRPGGRRSSKCRCTAPALCAGSYPRRAPHPQRRQPKSPCSGPGVLYA